MNDKNRWSEPDYESWRKGIKEVTELPSGRFYFVATMLSFVLIAYLVSDSILAVAVVSFLMLTFATGVFFLHRKLEGNGQNQQECEGESSRDTIATGEAREADGEFGFAEHDGNDPSGSGSVRVTLEGEETEASNNHPR